MTPTNGARPVGLSDATLQKIINYYTLEIPYLQLSEDLLLLIDLFLFA